MNKTFYKYQRFSCSSRYYEVNPRKRKWIDDLEDLLEERKRKKRKFFHTDLPDAKIEQEPHYWGGGGDIQFQNENFGDVRFEAYVKEEIGESLVVEARGEIACIFEEFYSGGNISGFETRITQEATQERSFFTTFSGLFFYLIGEQGAEAYLSGGQVGQVGLSGGQQVEGMKPGVQVDFNLGLEEEGQEIEEEESELSEAEIDVFTGEVENLEMSLNPQARFVNLPLKPLDSEEDDDNDDDGEMTRYYSNSGVGRRRGSGLKKKKKKKKKRVEDDDESEEDSGGGFYFDFEEDQELGMDSRNSHSFGTGKKEEEERDEDYDDDADDDDEEKNNDFDFSVFVSDQQQQQNQFQKKEEAERQTRIMMDVAKNIITKAKQQAGVWLDSYRSNTTVRARKLLDPCPLSQVAGRRGKSILNTKKNNSKIHYNCLVVRHFVRFVTDHGGLSEVRKIRYKKYMISVFRDVILKIKILEEIKRMIQTRQKSNNNSNMMMCPTDYDQNYSASTELIDKWKEKYTDLLVLVQFAMSDQECLIIKYLENRSNYDATYNSYVSMLKELKTSSEIPPRNLSETSKLFTRGLMRKYLHRGLVPVLSEHNVFLSDCCKLTMVEMGLVRRRNVEDKDSMRVFKDDLLRRYRRWCL